MAAPNPQLSPSVVVPIASAVLLGAAFGLAGGRASRGKRVARGLFFSSAFGYLGVSILDFVEHYRLEKEATGRYLACTAVPIGETVNHAATVATIVGMITLARPLDRRALRPRDWFTIIAPGVFLALGWRDELKFHRVRSAHREDIMHTVSHLAAGVMLTALYIYRLVRWR